LPKPPAGDGDALAALFGRHLMELSLHRRVMAHPRYCFSFWVRQLMCSRCRIWPRKAVFFKVQREGLFSPSLC